MARDFTRKGSHARQEDHIVVTVDLRAAGTGGVEGEEIQGLVPLGSQGGRKLFPPATRPPRGWAQTPGRTCGTHPRSVEDSRVPYCTSIDTITRNVQDILTHAMSWDGSASALVLHDRQCALACDLTAAYERCLPDATSLDYGNLEPGQAGSAFDALSPGDLVVLIQSTRFQVEAFRLRIELFKRSLKVIEHPHLARMAPDEAQTYVDALAYDPVYTRETGVALKERVDRAKEGSILGDGLELVIAGPLEPARLNVGDYAHMQNVGGQYPIGEVFTEAQRLEDLHGRARVYAFGDTSFCVNRPATPITLVIEDGRVVQALESTDEFDRVLAQIRRDEDEVLVRELGLGLNRALTRERIVNDIGTYERMCGIHLSLGAKHHAYKKPGINKKFTKHHVDVFLVVDGFFLDGMKVYGDGEWCVLEG